MVINKAPLLKSYEPTARIRFEIASVISIGNSMICSDIWYKYHK